MNWTANDIVSNELIPSEHDSLGKKSNGYNTFIRVAFATYKAMSVEEQEGIIEQIMGTRMYVTNVTIKVIVLRY